MNDYPDWQQFPTAMGGNLFPAVAQDLTPGAHPTPVVPVTSYSSLSVVISPTAGAGTLTVSHWADPAGTVSAESDTWRYRPGAALVMRTPLRAAYVSLTLTVTSPGNLTASTWASLLASASDRVSYPVTAQQAGVDNTVLDGGAVDQWRMPAINAGPAMLAFAPGNTLAVLQVEVYTTDELDNIMYHLMFPALPAAAVMQPLQLPGEITVVQVTNTDAANAHSYGVTLLCPPQLPPAGGGAAAVPARSPGTTAAACPIAAACAAAAARSCAATSSTWVIVPGAAITSSPAQRHPAAVPARVRVAPAARLSP